MGLNLILMSTPSLSSPLAIHPAKAALLAQIRLLETQIARLDEEKISCQYQIEQYYRLFRIHLGDVVAQLSDLQMKVAFQRASLTGRRSDAEEAQAYKERFEKTNQAIDEAKAHQPAQLDDTTKHELRRLYRQAVSKAHPDRYANNPDHVAQATAFTVRLTEAYKRQDIAAVRQLVHDLHTDTLFTNLYDETQTLDVLQQWYTRLLERQVTLQAEIARLNAEEPYQLMTDASNLTGHFSALRQRMHQQIQYLTQQLYAA